MKLLKFVLLGFIFIVFGCVSKKNMQQVVSIEKTQWKLMMVGTTDAAKADAYITLGGEPGKLRGKAGCNGIGGSYKITGSQIEITEIIGTKMACPELEIENAFIKALEKADNYTLQTKILRLYEGKTLLATFRALPL